MVEDLHHFVHRNGAHIFHTVVQSCDFRGTAGGNHRIVISCNLKIFRNSHTLSQSIFYCACGKFVISGGNSIKMNTVFLDVFKNLAGFFYRTRTGKSQFFSVSDSVLCRRSTEAASFPLAAVGKGTVKVNR